MNDSNKSAKDWYKYNCLERLHLENEGCLLCKALPPFKCLDALGACFGEASALEEKNVYNQFRS